MNISLRSIGNKFLSLAFWLCICIIVWIILSVFCVASFKIPSDSMEPTLFAGDNVLVNKLEKGARIFNLKSALDGKDFNIRRTPGFSSFQRNDVLVFNFPYPVDKKAIQFDLMKYYIKRCIALPGDTLEIRNGYFRIKGEEVNWKNKESQDHLSELLQSNTTGIAIHTYPNNKELRWTIKEFGPLAIPRAGQSVKMDDITFSLYWRIIEWEQKKKLKLENDNIYLGDSLIAQYQFIKNYYFVAGDKLQNSNDSRYWGLLPEEFIVGKATLIWKSTNPSTGKLQWNRILKRI